VCRFSKRGFFIAILFLLGIPEGGFSPPRDSGFEIQSWIGFTSFDKALSFERSPSFGLGVGHHITSLLQLNLTFVLNPTQQRITTATSKTNIDINIYSYAVDIKISNRIEFLIPFFDFGVGGIIFDSESVTLDLGGGKAVDLKPPTKHKFSLHADMGLLAPISKKLAFVLFYKNQFHQVKEILDGVITTKSTLAWNKYLGLGLSVSF
jgi:hypothetical protein